MPNYKDPEWNAWTRAWYVIGEHAHVDLCANRTISCRMCSQLYNSYGWREGSFQGHDICAWAKFKDGRWSIHCGYGSDFDMHEFWYIKDYPTEPIDGICDWCIRRMVRDGVIIDSGKDQVL